MRTSLLLASAMAVGCTANLDMAQFDEIDALTGDVDAGATVYADLCERCHGPGGNGDGPGPELTTLSATTSQIIEIVLTGPGFMPSFADEANQDLADVSAYVETLATQ